MLLKHVFFHSKSLATFKITIATFFQQNFGMFLIPMKFISFLVREDLFTVFGVTKFGRLT